MNAIRVFLLSLVAMACHAAEPETTTVTEREGQPMVTYFKDSDPLMAAAQKKARDTLAEFEKRLIDPPATQTRISLKGRFEEDGNVEHMWIEDVVITNDGYHGRLGNHPLEIQGIDVGDMVTVKPEHVSDWFAVDGGKLVGGYTLRLQRSRMPPDKQAKFDESVDFVIAE
jgi:uncharacterized protein YegJ (DUF2314 family)